MSSFSSTPSSIATFKLLILAVIVLASSRLLRFNKSISNILAIVIVLLTCVASNSPLVGALLQCDAITDDIAIGVDIVFVRVEGGGGLFPWILAKEHHEVTHCHR